MSARGHYRFDVRPLRVDDVAAVLAFELENRAYFARYVNDRGDAFYARFAETHRASLDQQQAGVCRFHVVVEPDGRVIGRVNLYDVAESRANLGYRIAERVAGHGVTTEAVRRVTGLADGEYGLQQLRATAGDHNIASRRVLEKAGFIAVGPTDLFGQPATRYERKPGGVLRAAGRGRMPPGGGRPQPSGTRERNG